MEDIVSVNVPKSERPVTQHQRSGHEEMLQTYFTSRRDRKLQVEARTVTKPFLERQKTESILAFRQNNLNNAHKLLQQKVDQ